jgi:hypothetical protein
VVVDVLGFPLVLVAVVVVVAVGRGAAVDVGGVVSAG